MTIESLLLDETADKEALSTQVLQPRGSLSDTTEPAFQTSLNQAIAEADAVVVDLLWIPDIDPADLTVLVSGMTQASKLGKPLSFLSMKRETRSKLEVILQKLHAMEATAQVDVFAPEFAQFLEQYQASILNEH